MTNVLSVINSLFTTALRTLHPEFKVPKSFVQLNMSGGKFGDYKCNTLALAQVTASECVRCLIDTGCEVSSGQGWCSGWCQAVGSGDGAPGLGIWLFLICTLYWCVCGL